MDYPDAGMLAVEHATSLVTTGEGFLRERNRENGRNLSKAVGAGYGAAAGFALGGPLGAAILAPITGFAGGLLFEGGLAVRSLFTGEKFD